ncbi:MAG: AEC family transporter [Opitutales bacterium]
MPVVLDFQTLVYAIVPVFLLVAVGTGARGLGFLPQAAEQGLTKLLIYALYPSFILTNILGNEALNDLGTLWMAPVLGFASIAGGMALGWAVGRFFGLEPLARRTFGFCVGIFNYGYMAIPVTKAVFPGEGTLGLLLVFNVGVDIAIWTVGVLLLTGGWQRDSLKRLLNGPLIAMILGLSLNAAGLGTSLPSWLMETLLALGGCAIPFGIILIGAAFFDEARTANWLTSFKVPALGIVTKLGLIPALMLLTAWALPIPQGLRNVLLIQAAMPCGIFPIVLTRHFGGDGALATKVVVVTTVIGLVSIPLWLKAGYAWVGP